MLPSRPAHMEADGKLVGEEDAVRIAHLNPAAWGGGTARGGRALVEWEASEGSSSSLSSRAVVPNKQRPRGCPSRLGPCPPGLPAAGQTHRTVAVERERGQGISTVTVPVLLSTSAMPITGWSPAFISATPTPCSSTA